MKLKLLHLGLWIILSSCLTPVKISTNQKLVGEKMPERLLIISFNDSDLKGFPNKLKIGLKDEINKRGTLAFSYDRTDFDSSYFNSFFDSLRCNGLLHIEPIQREAKTSVTGEAALYWIFGVTLISIKDLEIRDSINNKTLWQAVLRVKWGEKLDIRANEVKDKILKELYK